MNGKDATKSAKDATVRGKDATIDIPAKDATMCA